MSDLCELETKMKPHSRYTLIALTFLGAVFAYDYIINGMHPFDLGVAFVISSYAVICWRSR